MTVRVSVIIPTYQRRESLRAVLSSLRAQTLPPSQFEVIVSIDGSPDGMESMLARFDAPYALRWTSGPKDGPGTTRNRGAALANGDVFFFLDDDIIAAPALLAQHFEAHRSEPDRVVCLGQVRTLRTARLTPWERYLSQRLDEHYDKLNRPGYQLTHWDCLSGNISLSRLLWQQAGGFDATFAANRHEDIEFGYRLARLDARFVYTSEALGYHYFTRSAEAGLCDAFADGQSAQRLADRYPALHANLIDARWQHYKPPVRTLVGWILGSQARHARLAAFSAGLLRLAYRVALPLWLGRPVYQLAYHLCFWQGVRAEAGASALPHTG